MRKIVLLSLAALLPAIAVSGEDIPDLSSFSRSQASVCFDENFNSDVSRWTRPLRDGEGFKVTPHVGVTGSSALSATSDKEYNLPSWKVPVQVIPGMAYRISFHYRFDDLKVKKTSRNRVIVCSLMLKDKNTGAKLRDINIWVTAENTNKELRHHVETVVIPDNAAPEATFSIHVDWWHNGTFIYDDFTFA